MYVMKMVPVFKDYLWGGSRLMLWYNKHSDLDIVAESWEVACHHNGVSVVVNGAFAGKPLNFVYERYGAEFLGSNCRDLTRFPILVKLIDSAMDLSVQVHPDDEFAFRHEGEYGKAEAWVVLDCDIGASIYYGLKREVSRDELRNSISDGSVTELLNKVIVQPGDVFFIAPGTIHAIGAGIVIAEIQQNSDVSYRLFDYDRRDANGNLRPLHIDKGISCANLNPVESLEVPQGYLAYCEYFSVKKLQVESNLSCFAGSDSFQVLLVIEGEGSIVQGGEPVDFVKGDCFFVPASLGEFDVNGSCEILVTTIES